VVVGVVNLDGDGDVEVAELDPPSVRTWIARTKRR